MKPLNARLMLFSILVAAACATQVTDPDSETHWLTACDEDAECGSRLQCLCGVCTSACSGDCSIAGARCIAAVDYGQCVDGRGTVPSSGRVCVESCDSDADCSSALECRSSLCTPSIVAQVAPDGGDASARAELAGTGGMSLAGGTCGALFPMGGMSAHDAEPTCGAVSVRPEIIEPNNLALVFLLDRSDAMHATDSSTGYMSDTRIALERLLTLPYVADVPISFGYFPLRADADGGDSCEVARFSPTFSELSPAAEVAPELVASLEQQVPAGNRPLGPALEAAFDHLATEPGVRRFVVVVTAGAPNACEPVMATGLADLTAAHSADVTTVLVGLGSGLDGTDALTAPFARSAFVNDPNVAGALMSALLEVLGLGPGCVFSIPDAPSSEEFDPALVSVQLPEFGGSQQTVPYVVHPANCSDNLEQGWYYDDESAPSEIRLCPGTCERAAAAGVAILYGCPMPVPLQ